MEKYATFEVKQVRINGVLYCKVETENKNFIDLNEQCHYMNLIKSMEHIATKVNAQGYGCYFTMG